MKRVCKVIKLKGNAGAILYWHTVGVDRTKQQIETQLKRHEEAK